MKKELKIPEGYEARIEGNKIILELKDNEDESIRKIIADSVFYHYGEGVEYQEVLEYLDRIEKRAVPSRNEIMGIWELGDIWKAYPEEREGLTQLQFIQKHWYDKNDYNSGEPEKSFCEENCKGYKDTGGKCFFGFNCSVKKAQEQPEVDLKKEMDKLVSLEYVNQPDDKWEMCIAHHFYELGKNAK